MRPIVPCLAPALLAVCLALECPEHAYRDAAGRCLPCTYKPCGVGFFREACRAGSDEDARCAPCTPAPPPNATFVTGGLPYLSNNCRFECNAGFFRTESLACQRCSTEPCEGELARSECPAGSVQDSVCRCPPGFFIEGTACSPCTQAPCHDPSHTRGVCSGFETIDSGCL